MKNIMFSVFLCFGIAGTSEAAIKCYSCFDSDTSGATNAELGILGGLYTSTVALAKEAPSQTTDCKEEGFEEKESLTTGGCSTCFKFTAEKDGKRYVTGRGCSSLVDKCDGYPVNTDVGEGIKTTLLCCTGDKCNGATRGLLSPLLLSVLAALAVAATWRM